MLARAHAGLEKSYSVAKIPIQHLEGSFRSKGSLFRAKIWGPRQCCLLATKITNRFGGFVTCARFLDPFSNATVQTIKTMFRQCRTASRKKGPCRI